LRLFDISPARAFAGKIADVSKAVDKNSPIALFSYYLFFFSIE